MVQGSRDDLPCEARGVRTSSILALIASLFTAGCCFGGGWNECDSSSHVGGCRGNHFAYCLRTSSPWTGEVEELMEGDCAADEVCVEPSPGMPGCVVAPATPCEQGQPGGRCDGDRPVLCMSPNSWITDSYLVHNAPCTNGWSCRVEEGYAACAPP